MDIAVPRRCGSPIWASPAEHKALCSRLKRPMTGVLMLLLSSFPPAGDLPASLDEEATTEIKLDLAILKYARFARGGRLNPRELSELFDQVPPFRDPKIVLMEIQAARVTDAYLQSLHPKHEQFIRLRQALLRMRKEAAANSADNRRLIINMERWWWMPEDLGSLYVWSNTPEFMLYVVKDGKTLFADKTQVGTADDPTPVSLSQYDHDCLQSGVDRT